MWIMFYCLCYNKISKNGVNGECMNVNQYIRKSITHNKRIITHGVMVIQNYYFPISWEFIGTLDHLSIEHL